MTMPNVEIYPDERSLTRAAAERFVSIAEAALTTQARFTVALSGGNTPRALYQLLATDEFIHTINWEYTFVFWGDERCLPPDHFDSNYHMGRELLLNYVPVPMDHIFRIYGEIEPADAAETYEARLREFFAGRSGGDALRPTFDLALLGMGGDGHTASLFPHTPALDEQERWVVAQFVEKLDVWRVTLTPIALNAASSVLFLVSGESKAQALRAVFSDDADLHDYPARLVQPEGGRLLWMVDEAAASLLE